MIISVDIFSSLNTDFHFHTLGGIQLGQSSTGDELKHWLLMVKSPDQWTEMWHKLKPEHYHSPLRQRDSQTSR